MKPGSWGSIWLVYLYSILCAASISKIVPIEGDLERTFHTTPAGVGLAISIIAVSSLFAATIGGAIIDRIGARPAIVWTSILIVLCNVAEYFATSMFMLDAVRLIEGIEFIGIVVAAPALIMATTTGKRQVQAMTLWSTYTPAGVGLGLLIAVPFAGTAAWRWTFILHGALVAGAVLLAGLLPSVQRESIEESSRAKRIKFADLLQIYREPGPWKLTVSNALLVSAGLGTTTVVPLYFLHVHHVSVALSSGILAFSNIPMILAGIVAGALLARGTKALSIYIVITVAGIASGLLLYAPWVSFPFAVTMLLIWQPMTGAAVAVLMALLPRVTRDPMQGGAAMGLVGQGMAFINFITPPIYLSLVAKQNWLFFAALVVGSWIISIAFLPASRRPSAAAPTSLASDASVSVSS